MRDAKWVRFYENTFCAAIFFNEKFSLVTKELTCKTGKKVNGYLAKQV